MHNDGLAVHFDWVKERNLVADVFVHCNWFECLTD